MKSVIALGSLLCATAFAGEAVKSTSADLDGDGKEEAISIQSSGDGAFKLAAGGVRIAGQVKGNELSGFTVDDLDTRDARREVLVHTIGQMDEDHRVLFYGFDGKRWTHLGTLTSAGEIKGNGIVLVDSWAGFWPKREKFTLDSKKKKLVATPQDLYWVGVDAQVKKSFPIQRSRTDSQVVANVAPGSKLTVVASAPDPKNERKDWYLIKTSTGLMGWAKMETISEGLELPWAG